jgi:hypothetical protein
LTMNLDKRLSTYSSVSTGLSLLSNLQLMDLLDKARPLGASIGGITSLLEINDTLVFVKRIPLTNIEREPQNILSTANVFNLPIYSQYGIGSPGFGVWREIAAHTMSTNWVIAGECPNFPLMYHWRVLALPESGANEALERNSGFLNEFAEVRARLDAMQGASSSIVIFLEYFPQNVHQWLSQEVSAGHQTAEAACFMLEENLKAITSFINSRGMLHFDAHFWNILTDGEQLYFTDFGLAISSGFALSKAERDFFKQHHRYDQCYTITHLVKWLLIELFGEENWWGILHEYASGTVQEILPPGISAIIVRYAPICIVMTNFFEQLKLAPASTPYPVDELERLCEGIQ